jgi:hypothetical protein
MASTAFFNQPGPRPPYLLLGVRFGLLLRLGFGFLLGLLFRLLLGLFLGLLFDLLDLWWLARHLLAPAAEGVARVWTDPHHGDGVDAVVWLAVVEALERHGSGVSVVSDGRGDHSPSAKSATEVWGGGARTTCLRDEVGVHEVRSRLGGGGTAVQCQHASSLGPALHPEGLAVDSCALVPSSRRPGARSRTVFSNVHSALCPSHLDNRAGPCVHQKPCTVAKGARPCSLSGFAARFPLSISRHIHTITWIQLYAISLRFYPIHRHPRPSLLSAHDSPTGT